MSAGRIELVIDAQTALIEALDNGRVEAIEAATRQLSQALARVREAGAWHADDKTAARVDHALRQTAAAATRVNYLADRTRQRLGRVAMARGSGEAPTYDARGKARLSLGQR
jgi:predicted translin family RNA/ssDNA-binding protein